VGFKSSSDGFHLSPDIDEGFRVSGSGDFRIFKISKHEIEFGTPKEIHTFFEVPGVSPPMFLSQGIPFSYGLGFSFGEIEDIPEFFFEEKDFLYGSSSVDFDHLRDEKMFFSSPSIHSRFRSSAIKASRQLLRNSFQGAIVLDDFLYGFRDGGLSSPLASFNPFDGKKKAFMGATWVSTFHIDHLDLEQKTTFKVRGIDGAPMLFFLAEGCFC
jgi:hypothetical protein